MLIDFSEITLSRKDSIFFIDLLLRYSRLLCVYVQDHKYNGARNLPDHLQELLQTGRTAFRPRH